MNLIQLAATCVFVMPIDAPSNASLTHRVEPTTVVPVDDVSGPVARSEPEVRISIGIDPLEWITPNRY